MTETAVSIRHCSFRHVAIQDLTPTAEHHPITQNEVDDAAEANRDRIGCDRADVHEADKHGHRRGVAGE
jgi:hypothetical protein